MINLISISWLQTKGVRASGNCWNSMVGSWGGLGGCAFGHSLGSLTGIFSSWTWTLHEYLARISRLQFVFRYVSVYHVSQGLEWSRVLADWGYSIPPSLGLFMGCLFLLCILNPKKAHDVCCVWQALKPRLGVFNTDGTSPLSLLCYL